MFSIFKRERRETEVERALREELELVKAGAKITQERLEEANKGKDGAIRKGLQYASQLDDERSKVEALTEELDELKQRVKLDKMVLEQHEAQALLTQKAHLEQMAKVVGQVDLVKGLEIDPRTVSMGLAGVTEQTAWWKALHSILNQEIMLARDASVQPNLSSETRHYNAGRCAGLVDLQATLLGAWAKEQKVGEGS